MAHNFGKYAILGAITHYFEDEPTWYWKIQPPNSGVELKMAQFLQEYRLTRPDGSRELLTDIAIAHQEIALLFAGSNIPVDISKPVEDGGEALLKPGASIEDIKIVLSEMPQIMVFEIWMAIAEGNFGWGPTLRKPAGENDPSQ
jgi:hypothetical protein